MRLRPMVASAAPLADLLLNPTFWGQKHNFKPEKQAFYCYILIIVRYLLWSDNHIKGLATSCEKDTSLSIADHAMEPVGIDLTLTLWF